MLTTLLVVLIIVEVFMIGFILLQKSEGGGLVSGGGGAGGFMTARGAANFLTRSTAVFATLFFAISLVLAVLTKKEAKARRDVLNAQKITEVSKKIDQSVASVSDKKPEAEGSLKDEKDKDGESVVNSNQK